MQKIALITGVTGQDGSYLAELLLQKGYKVIGLKRRTSVISTSRIDHLYSNPDFKLEYGSMEDSSCFYRLFSQYKFDEVYNLAAQSHVRVSFDVPEETAQIDAIGPLRLLECIRLMQPEARFYQASSSEMYGDNPEVPQSELTRLQPASPYACAKVFAHGLTRNYREGYKIHASSGILFNHESPRRGETFVTRKITRGLGMILRGERDRLVMGNLDSFRDWGHSKDYVKGMWLILQNEKADDYVLSTNEYHSVREFIELSFGMRGFDIKWKGEGLDEVGYDSKTGRDLIFVSATYFRPAEVDMLLGDSTKARTELGWKPEYSFINLVREMVDGDCPLIQ
jgi:GDPmannose 4,6-dehydratase